MVAPPPGVSSMASSPPMASVKPRAMARPSPTPLPWSTRRWNGWKTLNSSDGRTAGALLGLGGKLACARRRAYRPPIETALEARTEREHASLCCWPLRSAPATRCSTRSTRLKNRSPGAGRPPWAAARYRANGPQLTGACRSRSRFSSRTFTALSPRNPSARPVV